MTNDLYYKPIMIVNDDSSIVNLHETSLIDNARVVIYNCHVFTVQATSYSIPSYEFIPTFRCYLGLTSVLRNQNPIC